MLAAASALSYGALGVLAKLAYADGWQTAPLLAVRFGLAALCVAPFALLAKGPWRGFCLAFLVGGLGYVATTALYFPSIRYLPAAVASFLLFLAPVFVVVLAHFTLHERMGWRGVTGLALALGGLVLTTLGAWTGDLSLVGILFAVGSACTYAVSVVVGRRIAQTLPWHRSALGVTLGACAAYTIFSAATGRLDGPDTSIGWLWALGIGTLATGLPLALWFAALSRIGASETSVIGTLEPVSTLALAAIFLAEVPGVSGIAGGLLIVVAAAVVAWQTPTLAPHE